MGRRRARSGPQDAHSVELQSARAREDSLSPRDALSSDLDMPEVGLTPCVSETDIGREDDVVGRLSKQIVATMLSQPRYARAIVRASTMALAVERAAKLLIRLAHEVGGTLALLRAVIELNFETYHKSFPSLLTDKSFAGVAVSEFSLLEGKQYLRFLLGTLLSEIVDLPADASEDEMSARLSKLAEDLIRKASSEENVDLIPIGIRMVGAMIAEFSESFSVHMEIPLVCDFIWKRFVARGFEVPSEAGLVEADQLLPATRARLAAFAEELRACYFFWARRLDVQEKTDAAILEEHYQVLRVFTDHLVSDVPTVVEHMEIRPDGISADVSVEDVGFLASLYLENRQVWRETVGVSRDELGELFEQLASLREVAAVPRGPALPAHSMDAGYHRMLVNALSLDLSDVERLSVLYVGGVDQKGFPLVVFFASRIPKHKMDMNRLFLHIIRECDAVVNAEYSLVYVHGAVSRVSRPAFPTLRTWYQQIDRKFKKNLQALYVIYPSPWLKLLFAFLRPVISGKFWKKLHYVKDPSALGDYVSLDQLPFSEDELAAAHSRTARKAGRASLDESVQQAGPPKEAGLQACDVGAAADEAGDSPGEADASPRQSSLDETYVTVDLS